MKLYPAGHPATLLIHAVAPDALAGWTRLPTAAALRWLPPGAADLPRLPRLLEAADAAAVRASGADLVVDCGVPGARGPAAQAAAAAGVPVLHLDGRLSGTPDAVLALGRAVGVEAGGLADAVAGWLDRTRGALKGLRLVYATGPLGREVPWAGTQALELFAHLGAEVLTGDGEAAGQATASDVAAFAPDHILLLDAAARPHLTVDPEFAGLEVVRAGRVMVGPDLPWFWLDRPPGINRVLGALWLCHRFGAADLRAEITCAFALLTHGGAAPELLRLERAGA